MQAVHVTERERTPKRRMFDNRYLLRLIVPLILEQTLAITVGMADTMMISSAGEAAVSGVSLDDMINNLIIAVLAALATGGAVVTSQYLGAGRRERACRSAAQVLGTILAGGVLIMAVTIALHRPVLRLFFGQIEPEVMHNCVVYLLISALSYPFIGVYEGCCALFRSMGNSRITFLVSIIMNLINIVGNAVGVFVLHAGVAGVAVPSLISRAVAALILYVLLRDQRLEVHLLRERFRPDRSAVQRILYIGIPNGIENGIFQLGRILVVSIISTFGTVQIAANGVANSLDGMSVIIGQAMSLAMISVIGQCVGAGDEEQVRYYMKKLLLITYVGSILLDLTIIALLDPILAVYGLSAATTALSKTLVLIHAGFAMALWPMAFVFPNMLRACNDVRYTMVVSIFSMFVFRILFSYVLGMRMGMGAIGVWIAMVIDWVFRVTFFLGRYLHGDWRRTMGL